MSRSSDEIVEVVTSFLTALRMGQGIDEPRLKELRAILQELAGEWSASDAVPKEVAGVLAELYPAMDASSHLYNDAQQAERIRDLAVDLSADVSTAFFG